MILPNKRVIWWYNGSTMKFSDVPIKEERKILHKLGFLKKRVRKKRRHLPPATPAKVSRVHNSNLTILPVRNHRTMRNNVTKT